METKRALREELLLIRARLYQLIYDLDKMMPRNVNTMSALRQEEITEFVVRKLRAALASAESEHGYGNAIDVNPKKEML